MLAVTYVLFERATEYKNATLTEGPSHPGPPAPPAIAPIPASAGLGEALGGPEAAAIGSVELAQDQYRLAQARHNLVLRLPTLPTGTAPVPAGAGTSTQVAQDQRSLAHDQHQLAEGQHSWHTLRTSWHRRSISWPRSGLSQAAQRAADSHQLLVNSGIALAIVAVLALLAGWLVAGRMLRPIRTITRTATRISSTSLHERLALDGPQDELKELGDTLDDLFGRLDAAFEAQRHFVANASHELRTPLTAERTLLQVALDDPHTSARAWRSTAEELLASKRRARNT